MGEMADYMINGDDCQYCGEYLGRGNGYPRACRGCSDYSSDSKITKEAKELIELGLTKLRMAAIILKEAQIKKKARGLNNMCDQLSKFCESIN